MRLEEDVTRVGAQIAALRERDRFPAELQALTASAYGRVVLGLAGYLDWSVAEMRAFLSQATWTEQEIQAMSENLALFADAVQDEDNAIYIAKIAAHPLLVRLMEHEHELIQEAAAHVVSICASSQSTLAGIAFPHRVRQLGKVHRAHPSSVPLPSDPRDAPNVDLAVLIRQVPARMTGQPKTGYLLWGASFVLARWLHLHRERIEGKTVLEVGSGLGLSGVVAARYAAQTILTDYQHDTCRALEYNVALNEAFILRKDQANPPPRASAPVDVAHLDWDSAESIQAVGENQRFDLVVASDIICEPSTADGFLRVVRARLSLQGVAILMNADAHSRFGVAYLHDALSKADDLEYSITRIEDLADGHILLAGVPDANELHYECYEIRLRG